jgi:transglutaminase-like putative cysteine protease
VKNWLILLLYLSFGTIVTAQTPAEYASVRYTRIPDSLTLTTTGIANYLNNAFSSDPEKIEAAYSWITSNLRYDIDSSNQINLGPDPYARVSEALRRRKGVCENFAWIFHDILSKCGIKSQVVQGYTRQSGSVDRTGHSWVAVFVNNDWKLADPTWDAGNGGRAKYFLLSPSEFILTHMPFDPLWQMLPYRVTHKQFTSGHLYSANSPSNISYKDSVDAYLQADSLTRFRESAKRIEQNGTETELVKNSMNYNKMQAEMIVQEEDVDLYNSAVEDLNEITSLLNDFINYRNQLFLPEKSDTELSLMLSGSQKLINSAKQKLDKIDRSTATFAISSDPVRTRLEKLQSRLTEQNDFLRKYLSLPKLARQQAFYK